MPIVDDKLKLVQNAATFEGLFNAVSTHPNTGTKFFKDNLTWDVVPKQFQSVITVAKYGYGDFVCSDAAYESDDQCIQAAIDYAISLGGGIVHLNKGHYICTSPIPSTASNITIEGQGASTILDFTSCPSGPFINISGDITITNSLVASTNAVKGDLQITVADGSKFSPDDWIRIRSEAIWRSWDNDGTNNVQLVGELQQIASVSGNNLTLKETLYGSYNITDTATVDLMSMIEHINIKNLKIIGAPSVDHVGIYIKNANDVIVDHVVIEDCYNTAIMLNNVVDAFVTRNIIKRSNMGGLGYGLAVLNSSRNITGTSNHFYECRHGIDSSGDHLYGVQYAQTYIGNTMSHSKLSVGMFGPHPTYDGYTVMGNTCIGCTLGGFNGINNVVIGNTVDNPSYSSPGILIPECAQNSIVSDNIIRVKNSTGIYVSTKYSNLSIISNQIKCDGTDTQGLSIANDINGLSIRGNTIECIATAISITDYKGTRNTNDCIITDNKLTSTMEYGIRINCPTYLRSNIKISGNIITAPDPILIGGATAKLSIGNNTLFATGKCIRLYSTASSHERIDIINNICHGGTNLIDFQQCNYIQVLGNVLYDATGYAVSCNADNTHYTITGNIITNCTSSIRNISPATDKIITNNIGYNPVGNFTAPTLPSSTTAYTNSYGYPCQVQISGGTVTQITLDGVATGMTSFFGIIPPGGTIAITYSSAPTWKWWGL